MFKSAKTSNPNLQIIINGNPLGSQSTRLGSGFVYDIQGHIITNNHVIDGANTADVTSMVKMSIAMLHEHRW
ncbi:MAG: hypothetical protein WA667_22645 [Candidatus Nitrosopolaris sp.]